MKRFRNTTRKASWTQHSGGTFFRNLGGTCIGGFWEILIRSFTWIRFKRRKRSKELWTKWDQLLTELYQDPEMNLEVYQELNKIEQELRELNK